MQLRPYPNGCLVHETSRDDITHFHITNLNRSLLFWLLFLSSFLFVLCCLFCFFGLLFQPRLHFCFSLRPHVSLYNARNWVLAFNIFKRLNLNFRLNLFLALLLLDFIFQHYLANRFPLPDLLFAQILLNTLMERINKSLLWIYAEIMGFYCLFCRPLLKYCGKRFVLYEVRVTFFGGYGNASGILKGFG